MTFNYASRDYDTIKSDLLARADRVFPEWSDRDPSDFGMLLVDLWAYMGDVLHYYADRAATEAFLETATQRESVLAIANLLDYQPRGRTAATGTVTVANTSGAEFVVPQYTEFIARSSDKVFTVYAANDTTIADSASVAVSCIEGALIEDEVLTTNASGYPGQAYTLDNVKAAPTTLTVFVYEDGVTATQYAYVNRLSDAAVGQRVFTYRLGPENFIEVMFGNAKNGFVPPTGATVTATYSACSGASGNLPADAVSGFASSQGAGLSVTGSSAFNGGSDAETIESMRLSIPAVFAVQNRAVTRNDFVALAQSVSGVSKAAVEFTPGAAGAVQNTVSREITSGVATLEVTAHGYSTDDVVRVDAVGTDYDGVHVITVTGVNTFTFATDGADEGNTADVDGTVFLMGNDTVTLYIQEDRSTDYLTTTDTSQTVDTDLRTLVEDTVQAKAMMGIDVTTAASIGWDDIDITATVYVNSKAVTNTVNSDVVSALDDLFDFDNVRFGQLLHLGQVHRIILNVPGVDYVEVTKFDHDTGGASSVQNSIQIADYRLPKKGTYSLTFSGGISTS